MIITISKGQQITIPSKIREELNLKEGTRLELDRKGNTIIIKPIEDNNLEDLFKESRNWKPKKLLTAKEMDKLIEDEIS